MPEMLCSECSSRKTRSLIEFFRPSGFYFDSNWVCSEPCLQSVMQDSINRNLDFPLSEIERHHRVRIGTLLVRKGVISQAQLSEAIRKQSSLGGNIGRQLVGLGHCTEGQLTAALSEQQGVPWVGEVPALNSALAQYLPSQLCQDFRIFPFKEDHREGALLVAAQSPVKILVIHMLRRMLGRRINVFILGDFLFDQSFSRFLKCYRPEEKGPAYTSNDSEISNILFKEVLRLRARQVRLTYYPQTFWARLARHDHWSNFVLRLDSVDLAGRSRQSFPLQRSTRRPSAHKD